MEWTDFRKRRPELDVNASRLTDPVRLQSIRVRALSPTWEKSVIGWYIMDKLKDGSTFLYFMEDAGEPGQGEGEIHEVDAFPYWTPWEEGKQVQQIEDRDSCQGCPHGCADPNCHNPDTCPHWRRHLEEQAAKYAERKQKGAEKKPLSRYDKARGTYIVGEFKKNRRVRG